MDLLNKITSKSANVGILGLGYVGLPLLAAFHRAGFNVIGFDTDPAKIEALKRGENYLKHLGENFVQDMKSAGRFDATSDFSRLAMADAIIICVPTPLGSHQEPDLSYVQKTAQEIARTLRPGQLDRTSNQPLIREQQERLSSPNSKPADYAAAKISISPSPPNAKTPAEKIHPPI